MNLHTLPRSIFRTAASLFCVGALLIAMAGRPNAADGPLVPPVPDPQDLIDLVRDTVLDVDAGNKSGDYGALHARGTEDFQKAQPPERLAEVFADLRAENMDLAPVRNMTPLTTGPPALDPTGKLRILGFFEIADRQLVYDLLYDYDFDEKRWRVAGIALRPRPLPSHPELMQPQ